MSAAQYRILSAAGDKREDGDADVEVRDEMLVLAPSAGSVLPIPFGHISSVTEPEPFLVRITLAGGDVIELSRLGVMHPAARRTARRPGGRGGGGRAGALLRGERGASRPRCGSTMTRCWSSARPALPARRDAIAELARRTDLAIGFKQLISVRRPATGTTPWQDHATAPHIGAHESPGGSFRPGMAGLLAAGAMSGGPGSFGFGEGYGAFGAYWAFRALGTGMNAGGQRPMAPRPDVTRGLLTPATEDLRALTAAGANPTVLAFALGSRAGRVVYEVLNQPEPMTVVYRADGGGGLAAINRALDDAGFQAAAGPAEGLAARVRPSALTRALAQSLVGRVRHDAQWPDRIAELLRD